jgi:hypothetical protein
VANAIKFICALKYTLLATLVVMNIFLNGYKKKDRVNEAGSSKASDVGKYLKEKITVHIIGLLDLQILMLIEKRGHNIYFIRKCCCEQHEAE